MVLFCFVSLIGIEDSVVLFIDFDFGYECLKFSVDLAGVVDEMKFNRCMSFVVVNRVFSVCNCRD